MPPDPIAELRRLLEKADSAPWHKDPDKKSAWEEVIYNRLARGRSSDNARLIVAAVNALPVLLDCVEALGAMLEASYRHGPAMKCSDWMEIDESAQMEAARAFKRLEGLKP